MFKVRRQKFDLDIVRCEFPDRLAFVIGRPQRSHHALASLDYSFIGARATGIVVMKTTVFSIIFYSP